MVAEMDEAKLLEQVGQRLGIGAGELDELETGEAERVFMGGYRGVSGNRSGGMARLLSAAPTPRK